MALVAGGHTFGKCHGAGDAAHVGPEPEAAGIEEQGLGWKSSFGSGKGGDTIGSGIEGAWKPNPTKWRHGLSEGACSTTSGSWSRARPARISGWPRTWQKSDMVVGRARPVEEVTRPMMTTADLSLRYDPIYEPIARRLPAEPRGIRGRLRQGVVQADAPRHGPARTLSRPGGSGRRAHLARPGARSRS